MNENLNNQIVALYNDPLFQELKAYYSKTTIFNILKIERNENRHSAFLAWLLDANGSHGLKEEPLRKFLRALAVSAVSETESIDKTLANSFVSGNYSYENLVVETEKSVETEKKGRIDVFVSFDMETANKETANKGNANNKTHVYIIIENKVYSKEHDEQTEKYLEWARKQDEEPAVIGVFLAPDKIENCSADSDVFEFVKFTYEDLLEKVIEPLLCMEMTDKNRWILNDYILNLGQPAKSWNDKEDKPEKEDRILAVSSAKRKDFRRLYRKHRVLFDTILICANVDQNNNQINSVFGNKKYQEVCNLDDTSKALLLGIWNNKDNQQLIKMTFNNWVEDNRNETEAEVWKTLLGLKSNRFNFIFNGECYKTKAELCHAIVESYIDKHPKVPEVTIEELRTTFRISNNFNTVETYGEAMMTEDSAKNPGGNYYISKPIPITINGCEDKVVVWRYWPEKYFNPFMEEVKKLGYEIK